MTSITIRLPEEEKEKLVERAKELDLSLSQVVRKAIRDMLNQE